MTIATFSLPIDIPWQRIAFSSDMMDKVACDRELPLRWRSSIAVFEYQPPEDQQQMDGFIVSYLKVACSITGYQPDAKEIRIRERLGRSGWTWRPLTEIEPKINLNDIVDTYHACYGAMLEVVVAPSEADGVRLEDYPYFSDFDPKKRELYEQVTDTGEIMSRSLDDVGVRLGQTTSQSHEVRDSLSLGASVSAGPKGGPGASVGAEHSTTDLNQRTTENIRTTDAARENRETLSHTTQLSQMYHQLNSYHLGTNRAAFFVQPRPHVVQSTDPDGTPRTFVDGPRQLEGIQEFMLVVVRPKDQAHICVEAYLETAHLLREPVYGPGTTATLSLNIDSNTGAPGTLLRSEIDAPNVTLFYSKSESARYPNDGSIADIDLKRGAGIDTATSTAGGYDASVNAAAPGATDVTFEVRPDHVLVNGTIRWQRTWNGWDDEWHDGSNSLGVTATVYLKSKKIVGYNDVLFITGRATCSCRMNIHERLQYEKDLSVVFEKKLTQSEPRTGSKREAISIHDANRFGAIIHREMLQSLSSADRYPRGMVSLLDTQFVSGVLTAHLDDADYTLNPRLTDWPGVQEDTLRRVTAYSPSITRMQLLQMPLAQQVERFGLSFAEAVDLRRVLADLAEPVGPLPVPERLVTQVPDLTGLQLEEARAALLSAKLVFGDVEVMDSPLPIGVVTGQSPQPGAEVDLEADVKLQISSGLSVRLPDVLNLRLSEAMCQLREAGLKSEPTVEGLINPGTVVSGMEPSPRSWVTPHARIALRVGALRRPTQKY